MADYIEKESLLKNFCGFDLTECVKYGNKTKEQACKSYDTLMMYEIAYAIEDAPCADVAPVIHGKWIEPHWSNSTSCANCSVCGGEAQNRDFMGVQKYYKFCPKCGAKMYAEKEEPTE